MLLIVSLRERSLTTEPQNLLLSFDTLALSLLRFHFLPEDVGVRRISTDGTNKCYRASGVGLRRMSGDGTKCYRASGVGARRISGDDTNNCYNASDVGVRRISGDDTNKCYNASDGCALYGNTKYIYIYKITQNTCGISYYLVSRFVVIHKHIFKQVLLLVVGILQIISL